jgi:diguanylate cyclase (GGDEF)-like protein
MTLDSAGPVVVGRLRLVPVAEWAVWSRPRLAVYYLLGVNAVAVALTLLAVPTVPVSTPQVAFAIVLVVGAVLYGEIIRGIELTRRLNMARPYVDLSTVWLFAAALLTHPALATLVVVTVYAHPWLRIRHHPVHRQVFSAATATIATQAAATVVFVTIGSFADAPRDLVTFAALMAAAAAFLFTNVLLIAGIIGATTQDATLRGVLADPADYALEIATMGLAILLAWSLADWPVALVLVFGVSLALHRNVLIRQFRERARTDPKTGLLNLATWRAGAAAELAAAAGRQHGVGLLMLDLDHFKRINDTQGHIAGDHILLNVAATIAGEVRGTDLVGRFGGDEFVVLLPGSDPADTREVAERIRNRVTALHAPGGRLSISIGASTYPEITGSLDDLLDAADHALLAAKDRGRDRVHIVHPRAG